MNAPALIRTSVTDLSVYLKQQDAVTVLQKNNCFEFPVDATFLRSRVSAVISGMKRITDDPELRKLFPWHIHREDAYGDKYRQEAGLDHNQNDGENKYVFQYIKGAAFKSGTVLEQSSCGAFLQGLADLDVFARELALVFGRYFDDAHGETRLYSGSLYDRILHGTVVTRVLRYLAVKNGKFDAYPHTDRGLLSFQLFATHEGLWIILPNGERARIKECDFGMVCAFLGRKYAAATQNAKNAAPHGVRYERVDGEDRFSIVVFIHPLSIDSDAKWLKENDATIKAHDRQIAL